jgi:cyclohexyl-isocyanide hydratase
MKHSTGAREWVIGSLIFPGMDQVDFTGPFEVLSRMPGARVHVAWKQMTPIKDVQGLTLTPTCQLAECPAVDVLHVPGGFGQEALMEDQEVLAFIRNQAKGAKYVLSVCTGALICGAAGLLVGRKATTHWASFDLLKYFGAIPVQERTVVDHNLITSSGVTAGIDAALRLAGLLCGERAAQEIQLAIEYAPDPPFNSGTPATAPADVYEAVRKRYESIQRKRKETAERVGRRLRVEQA